MKSNDIDQIKKDLTQLLDNLSRNTNEVLEKWANTSETLSDTLDKAILQTEMDYAFCRLLREGLNKENIMRALQKIDEGTYGICEACEEEISIGRLKAIPDARYCIFCQNQMEKEKIMVGA
ncbi:TraR/DksA family transcriptional regulator [Desulfosarcina ovata]|uniref:Molecular chaperone DnaK suppressor DksA n=1 Tax=Desulfosarcina ovata subsp. ovata TaxID=2752305 RepID=A0A5K8ALD1_9BACT|nr:TraR/DksA C4-type zinc finger protein [Desulfosarcina ovata]BBO93306.1 molecular chaperone DnaK suppressor DksA [Desulfosarcina ovata subsp. ovata]